MIPNLNQAVLVVINIDNLINSWCFMPVYYIP